MNYCAPQQPPPNEWVHPSGSREPKEDDQEVTFPGRGRWGPSRQPIPVSEQPAGGRVPFGPPQQLPCPALAGPDMGQLLTTLTSGLCIGTPKISTFSGDMAPGKTEVSYKQWSHEVQCIKDHYQELVVRESIMRSLKGQQQIWLAIWALLPVSLKFWKSFQSSLARLHHLMYLCKISIKSCRGIMKKCLHSQPDWRAL